MNHIIAHHKLQQVDKSLGTPPQNPIDPMLNHFLLNAYCIKAV